MASWSNAGLNAALSGVAAAGLYASIHSGDPSTTGANEVAVTRQAVTWGSPAGGSVSAPQVTFTGLPGSVTLDHFGIWSAASGGTFYGGGPLSSPESYSSAGGSYGLTPQLTATG